MPAKTDRKANDAEPLLTQMARRSQLDFEMEFFDSLLARVPDYTEVLQAHAGNLHTQGRTAEGLKVEERLVGLRPRDPLAHYNLACRYARMKQSDKALRVLRRAVELGYRDVRSLNRDADLESIRKDPRFRAMLRELTGK